MSVDLVLKGVVFHKLVFMQNQKFTSLITHSHVVPNVQDLRSSLKHKLEILDVI